MNKKFIIDSRESCRSWFCVLNNPQKIIEGEPSELAERFLEMWIAENPTRSGAVAYCISADGLHHLHMVLEDSNKARFSALKKAYPKAHLEPTKGTKEEAEDYINKRGKFAESGEQVLYTARHGEIKGNQGQRKDLEIIQDYIEQGMTPNEIMRKNITYRKHDRIIKDHFFQSRKDSISAKRDVTVYWHIGKSGAGKSYEHIKLIDKNGEDDVYFVNDYKNGFDKYNGENVLFMDEFRGQMPYNQLLTLLDGYKSQVSCRYTNVFALWTEVHITSVLPPEKAYQKMVEENRNVDTLDQLMRRISYIVFHQKIDGSYYKDIIPIAEYDNYDSLVSRYENEYTEIEVVDLPFQTLCTEGNMS